MNRKQKGKGVSDTVEAMRQWNGLQVICSQCSQQIVSIVASIYVKAKMNPQRF